MPEAKFAPHLIMCCVRLILSTLDEVLLMVEGRHIEVRSKRKRRRIRLKWKDVAMVNGRRTNDK